MRQVVVNDLVFGSGRMKICVPVCEKTTEAVLDAVKEIKTTPADLIEWRVDYFDEDMFAAAPEIFKAAAPLPVLCTFRTKAEGGEKAIDPMDYFAMNAQLSALGAPLGDRSGHARYGYEAYYLEPRFCQNACTRGNRRPL